MKQMLVLLFYLRFSFHKRNQVIFLFSQSESAVDLK